MQSPQIDIYSAISEAPPTALRLLELADRQRRRQDTTLEYHTTRHWESSAGTWCYQTHIAAPEQSNDRLAQLTRVFYNSATLASQPWYPQFLGGKSQKVKARLPEGICAQQLTLGSFDLGLRSPRYYRQLLSLAQPDAQTSVIVARSVLEGPTLPEGARLAYTLAPNGEVLHWENGRLHWHHICCTPGAGLLPVTLDRWFINALRATRLDGAERKTYRQEAQRWQDWLTSDAPELLYA